MPGTGGEGLPHSQPLRPLGRVHGGLGGVLSAQGTGPTVALRNDSPKGSQKDFFFVLGKCLKVNLSFEGVLRA